VSARYPLGASRREAARLRAQARLWDPDSRALFDRLGVRRGWKALELGPGQGSLHLELRRRVCGPVDAVEPSPAFAARLRRLTARDGFGAGRVWTERVEDADLPDGAYDLIFARWVFLFLPDPAARVRRLARALKPGGLLAVQDYHRETLQLLPRPRDWDDFLAADRAFFAAAGGDVSLGGRLPGLMRAAGLKVLPLAARVKSGGPGSPVWDWLSAYFLGVMPRYGAHRPFTPAKAARLAREWRAAARRPDSLLIAPALVDAVGRRPR
jgi:SAM-dependent methyltransferase